MSQEAHTAIVTTISGVIGGITKAVSAKPLLLAITFGGLSTVVIYASASAAAGYLVKKILDKVFNEITKRFENQNSGKNE
jgi:ribosomal protein L17